MQATGHSGSFMTEALLKTGRHTVTAITRSDNAMPNGAIRKKVDYNDPEPLVKALKGQGKSASCCVQTILK